MSGRDIHRLPCIRPLFDLRIGQHRYLIMGVFISAIHICGLVEIMPCGLNIGNVLFNSARVDRCVHRTNRTHQHGKGRQSGNRITFHYVLTIIR
ncbi:hypothetical protein PHDIMM138B_28465 [Phytobacter diazotrophicus]